MAADGDLVEAIVIPVVDGMELRGRAGVGGEADGEDGGGCSIFAKQRDLCLVLYRCLATIVCKLRVRQPGEIARTPHGPALGTLPMKESAFKPILC